MSWATLRLPKTQLESQCHLCQRPYQAENSLSNAMRSNEEKKVKVIAHRVDGIYHACHPDCFWQNVQKVQYEGNNPTCGICREEIGTIDGRSVVDPEAVVDNRERTVKERGQILVATMQCDVIFGARSKRQEIQKIFAQGKVPLQDLNRAAVIAAQKIEFDCIPDFLKMGPLFLSSRDIIVQYALDAFDWPTVRLLLPLGITDGKQETVLYRLAQYGDLVTLNALIRQRAQEGRRFQPGTIEVAASMTAERGEAEMTRALLDCQGKSLTQEGLANMIQKAICSRDAESEQSREVVRLILDRTHLSGYSKVASIAYAFGKGRFGIAWDIYVN